MTMPNRPIAALAAIAAVEGAACIGYGVYEAAEAVRFGATGPESVSNVPAIVLQVVLFLGFGAAMLVIARGWWRLAAWARSPFVLAQLIVGLIGYELAQSASASIHWAGIAMALVAVLGLVLVFTPAVSRSLQA
ncbi:MAG: hypothetical protein Q8M17_16125 [Actinomycetota bacterium]|nr:hypothetical protein [Actinomycetota bacterium]